MKYLNWKSLRSKQYKKENEELNKRILKADETCKEYRKLFVKKSEKHNEETNEELGGIYEEHSGGYL